MALTDSEALDYARQAHQESTDWFDAGPRIEIAADLRRFQGIHPIGSKYLAPGSPRSNFFRPRTRAVIRKNEAIACAALFDNADVVRVDPQDGTDPLQAVSAAVWHEALNVRLTTTIPWFLLVMGAYQDAQAQGIVASYQSWRYDPRRKIDTPTITIDAIENVRFSPNAEWHNVVGTSPYYIRKIPMYVKDVKERMKFSDGAEPKWIPHEDSVIMTAAKAYSDTLTIQRNARRADPASVGTGPFALVWVHQNFMECNGDDYVYYTLGEHALLSKPKLVGEVYAPLGGERPLALGISVVEAHKLYPGGPARLGKDIQAELNENANLRIDQWRRIINGRYLIRRGAQVDPASLMRNAPGASTEVTDLEKDVKELEIRDLPSSSFQEQDRLNLDFDDLLGTFSQSSAQSNRRIVDSKGGLELLSADSSMMGNYQLRVFAETWPKPVLRQVLKYMQHYETDERLLAVAGKKAAKAMRINGDLSLNDELLMQDCNVAVDIGVGATTPSSRLKNLLDALRAIQEALKDGTLQQAGMNVKEVVEEVFTKLGFDGADRFFPSQEQEDPRIAQLQQELDDANAKLAKKEDPALTAAKIKKLEAEINALQVKNGVLDAQKVKTMIEAIFGGMQAAEVVAAVPQVTPIADQIMAAAGYQDPTPPGVDPGFAPGSQLPGGVIMQDVAAQAQGALSVDPVTNKRTGIGFMPGAPGAAPPTPGDQTPGIPTNTNPLTPAKPASPFVGRNAGIETMRPDTEGAQR